MRATWVVFRVLIGIGGGYLASAAWSAALAVVLYRLAGFDRAESTVLCSLLGFAFYLFALLWAFSAQKLSHVAVVLMGGALLGYGLVRWLSPAVISAFPPLPSAGTG